MVMMSIPLDLLGPINATRVSSNAKLELKLRFLAKPPPAANVRCPPAHDCQPAHAPVAELLRYSDPEIQTKQQHSTYKGKQTLTLSPTITCTLSLTLIVTLTLTLRDIALEVPAQGGVMAPLSKKSVVNLPIVSGATRLSDRGIGYVDYGT
jgi:hypothetical protein